MHTGKFFSFPEDSISCKTCVREDYDSRDRVFGRKLQGIDASHDLVLQHFKKFKKFCKEALKGAAYKRGMQSVNFSCLLDITSSNVHTDLADLSL